MSTILFANVVTGRGKSEYRKVLTSEKNIFHLPDVFGASNEYDPKTILDDYEWFQLSAFSKRAYCLPVLHQMQISSVNYNAIATSDFGKIVFLYGWQDECFFFQRVTQSRQVNQRRVFFFGEQCKYEENSHSITLNDSADAIYCPKNDTLYFRKLRDISAIFNGIDMLFREATEDEVVLFLNYNFIETVEGFTSSNVKTNNRKRITQALETLKQFSEDDLRTVFDYVKSYCPELVNINNKFAIHDEDSLKRLLYGIEQRYYTTLVGKERRLANSVVSLSKNREGKSNELR